MDAPGEREPLTLKGHTGAVISVAFSPDGTRLASTSFDGTIKVWDPRAEPEARALVGCTVAFSPDGTRLAAAGRAATVVLWDATTGQEIRTLAGHTGPVRDVAFSPTGAWLVTAGDDHTVRLWDVAQGQERRTFEGHTGGVLGVAFSSHGRVIASAGQDQTVKLWDARTGQLLHDLIGHGSCDGRRKNVALAGDRRSVRKRGAQGSPRSDGVRLEGGIIPNPTRRREVYGCSPTWTTGPRSAVASSSTA